MRIKNKEELEGIDFYDILNTNYTNHYSWTNLQEKHEYGINKSEFGYQMIAKQMARRIAKNLGCDSNKAEVLSMAIGACFPRNGKYGMNLIKKYIIEKEMNIELSKLNINCIEESVGSLYKYISYDLDEALNAYYSERNDIPEVNIVRICQKTIDDIKKIESYNTNIYGGDLLFLVSEEIISSSKLTGKVAESPKLAQLIEKLPNKVLELPETEKEIMTKQLDEYINIYKENGIYKYLYSDGR